MSKRLERVLSRMALRIKLRYPALAGDKERIQKIQQRIDNLNNKDNE